jgi:hypothetical protein
VFCSGGGFSLGFLTECGCPVSGSGGLLRTQGRRGGDPPTRRPTPQPMSGHLDRHARPSEPPFPPPKYLLLRCRFSEVGPGSRGSDSDRRLRLRGCATPSHRAHGVRAPRDLPPTAHVSSAKPDWTGCSRPGRAASSVGSY